MQFTVDRSLSPRAAVFALGFFALACVHAADPRPTMTYEDLTKLIGQTQGDVAKTTPQVMGKSITVKLKSSNDALFVQAKDGIYFTCDQRAAPFKGGVVMATVTKYGLTPDGDVSVGLERCN